MSNLRGIFPEVRHPDLNECAEIVKRENRPAVYADGETTFMVFRVLGGDEATIHRLHTEILPKVGMALCDGKFSAVELVSVLSLFSPDIADIAEHLVAAMEEAIKAVADDGKISMAEGIRIMLKVLSTFKF